MKKNDKKTYNAAEIEPIWQSKWQKEKIYQIDLDSANGSTGSPRAQSGNLESSHEKKTPFYNLMMFPYPSAEGLHIGGVRTFVGVDIYARFNRMKGRDVFMPFGLDGFGIHAENYALKIGENPMTHAAVTETNYYRQMKESAISVDWSRTVETYKPDYYKWTQWLFTELFKSGLAYRKKSPVNFCPSCKTVLADEQVIDTKCERCSSVVVKKNLEQWFFRITEYADRLLNNIDNLNWTEKVKIAQRNWIGKKEGIEIEFQVVDAKEKITVFTTTPINFGATFLVVAPEHEIVPKITTAEHKKDVEAYIKKAAVKTEIERLNEEKEKTGVFTGSYVINHLTGEKIPVWIADYVLIGYGTGAVQGCPGHDERDFEFAKKYILPIPRVVTGPSGETGPITDHAEQVKAGVTKGKMVNSDFLNGMDFSEAMDKTKDYFEEKGWGKRISTYHLRDWLISRQRYWGPPIPMIYCEACQKAGRSWFNSEHSENSENQKVRTSDKSDGQKNRMTESSESSEMSGWYPAEDLPVELPFIEDFKPLGGDISPLGNHPEFYEVACPECGNKARRETDISDNFLDSSWYFLRYLATEWDDIPFPSKAFNSEHSENSENQKVRTSDKSDGQKNRMTESSESSGMDNRLKFLPVDMYIGGAEHSVLHLLYARFITMFLKDRGLIQFEEPFSRFYAHGMIIKEGAKMSKSKGNVVGPDVYVKKFGSDTLRMYLHFLSPFSQSGDFRDEGIEGMNRFLKKVWRLFSQIDADPNAEKSGSAKISVNNQPESAALRMLHQTIKAVTEEIENLRFNTAIAHLMTYYNFLSLRHRSGQAITREEAEIYLKLLAPFAPHMTEELYQNVILSVSEGSSKDSSAKPQNDNKFISIHLEPWPVYDEKYLVAEMVTIPVQVNGKLRSMLEISASETEDEAKIIEIAKSDEKAAKFLDGQKIKQAIYVPGKVLNFVV